MNEERKLSVEKHKSEDGKNVNIKSGKLVLEAQEKVRKNEDIKHRKDKEGGNVGQLKSDKKKMKNRTRQEEETCPYELTKGKRTRPTNKGERERGNVSDKSQ